MPAETSSEVYWFVTDLSSSSTALPTSRFSIDRRQEVSRRGVRGPGSIGSYAMGDGLKDPMTINIRFLVTAEDNSAAWSEADDLDASLTSARRLVKVANKEPVLDSTGANLTDASGAVIYLSVGHSIELHGLVSLTPTESADNSEVTRFYSCTLLSKYGAPIEGSAASDWAYLQYESTA